MNYGKQAMHPIRTKENEQKMEMVILCGRSVLADDDEKTVCLKYSILLYYNKICSVCPTGTLIPPAPKFGYFSLLPAVLCFTDIAHDHNQYSL